GREIGDLQCQVVLLEERVLQSPQIPVAFAGIAEAFMLVPSVVARARLDVRRILPDERAAARLLPIVEDPPERRGIDAVPPGPPRDLLVIALADEVLGLVDLGLGELVDAAEEIALHRLAPLAAQELDEAHVGAAARRGDRLDRRQPAPVAAEA